MEGFTLMTTSATVIGEPNAGNHYAPAASLLAGAVSTHQTGMADLAMNECGFPIDFSPLDWESDGGNMALWDDVKGGAFPWDSRYYEENPDTSTGFDPEYIMRHATDSANTAGCMATGHKAAVNMMSVNLYEEDVSTLVEDAMMCGMAGGVVTSVPMLHATPGAFVTHTNNRSDRDTLRRGFERVNPTMASGVCGGRYYPYPETLQSMRDGALSSKWTLLEQQSAVLAEVGTANRLTYILPRDFKILATKHFFRFRFLNRTFMTISQISILIMAITFLSVWVETLPRVGSLTCHSVAPIVPIRIAGAPQVLLLMLVKTLVSKPPQLMNSVTTTPRKNVARSLA
jgi:hypothetical protein